MSLDGSPRERLASNLKTPYSADEPVWSALLDALAAEFEALEQARAEVRASKFVGDADEEPLERLAELFDVERRTNEDLALFRIRVQIALRQQLSTATIREIRETVSVLLDVGVEDVVVESGIDPASADLGVPEQSVWDLGLTTKQLVDEAEALAAGGVSLEPFAIGSFEHVSQGTDPTDEESGYGTLADDTIGGTYASLLNN